jgi:hypothetical protein
MDKDEDPATVQAEINEKNLARLSPYAQELVLQRLHKTYREALRSKLKLIKGGRQ